MNEVAAPHEAMMAGNATQPWRRWKLPGDEPGLRLYVDEIDKVRLTEFSGQCRRPFRPGDGDLRGPSRPTAPGEVGAESGTGRLVVIDIETGSCDKGGAAQRLR
jgi:streptogramin lyase